MANVRSNNLIFFSTDHPPHKIDETLRVSTSLKTSDQLLPGENEIVEESPVTELEKPYYSNIVRIVQSNVVSNVTVAESRHHRCPPHLITGKFISYPILNVSESTRGDVDH
jgi:hypothetical protein